MTILVPLRQGFMFLCVCDYVCSLLLKYNDRGGPHYKIGRFWLAAASEIGRFWRAAAAEI